MKQQKFESLFRSEWIAFESFLNIHEKKVKKKDRLNSTFYDFPKQYRKMCYFLAIAKERRYGYFLVNRLNDLIIRGHQHLYKTKANSLKAAITFFVHDFPARVRREWKLVFISILFFILPGLLMTSLTYIYPELIYSVFDQAQINEFEGMYNPETPHVGKSRDSDTNLQMYGYYIAHNIGISFQTFAGGILLGVGTLYYLFHNGIMLGAISARMITEGFSATFFPFVIGHSAFELTAIIIAGTAGFKIGLALAAPGRYRRTDALKQAALASIKLMFGVMALLFAAAFIEAFWSASTKIPNGVKYAVGSGLWGLTWGYFLFSGRNYGS